MPRSEYAHGRKKTDSRPQTCPAYSQSFREFALRGQTVARLQLAITNHVANLNDDLLGHQTIFSRADRLKGT